MSDFQTYMPIVKVDKERRTVTGYASTPAVDGDGEIVTLEAIRDALPKYMDYANIREMHALKAVGVAQEANVDKKGLFLTAKIVDNGAWEKCLEGVYKGFSIGGRKIDKQGNKITELEMTEISVVDRPSNPDCRFAIAKSAKTLGDAPGYLVKVKQKPSTEAKALAKMARIVEDLAKAGPPAAHDGFSLPAKTDENLSPKDPSDQNNKSDGPKPCEAHNKINCEECKADKADGPKPCEAHGEINCDKCAAQKRDFSEEKRQQLAASGAAMPDGSFPIENAEDLKNAIGLVGNSGNPSGAKKHIKRRAKALGLTDKLPQTWGKGKKEAKKLAKATFVAEGLPPDPASFLTLGKTASPAPDDPFVLRKGMGTVASLSYSFDSIRDVQRRLLMEAKREGGDMKDKGLSTKLGSIAKDLADVIGQKALHEGGEALDMSDGDDAFIVEMFGEGIAMDKVMNTASGDPLTDAMALLMKRAATPSRAQRMEMAADNVKKSRKAAKAAREAIEDCHKMLKASYMAKAAKKDGKSGDDGEFDHAGAMEKLQKAFGEVEKARMFGKAAAGQIAKAVGRSGERGQEAGDPEAGFYEVPAGVKDLTPAAMAGAAPGTSGGGSMPPAYPADGSVYPGKAAGVDNDLRKYADKNGMVPAHVAELVMKAAAAEGQLEVFRNMPTGGGRKPYGFDMTKVMGNGDAVGNNDMRKALFADVDVGAIGSGDEMRHTAATAKVIGNLLSSAQHGKSILDPSFRGMAGNK
jgi:hypothetical protein